MALYTVLGKGFDPYYNLALEEYLLSRVPDSGCILYLWQNDHTVVIGRNQNPWVECRTSLLQEEKGHLARRLSGGGAVYHDLGNLNFTFLCREEHYDLQKQLSVIQRAVKFAGIDAYFSGRNDLLADGRKFSGNAFYHKKGAAYHHGTLLIDTDTDKMGRYLSPPKAKLESKGIASVRSRVVNLKELSPALSCETMKTYMVQAFSEIYGGCPQPLPLCEAENAQILQLRQRYAGEDWLYGKPMPFSCTLEGRFSFGSLQLQLSVEGGVITGLQAYTDAMDAELPGTISAVLAHCPFQAEDMVKAVLPLEIGKELADFIRTQQI